MPKTPLRPPTAIRRFRDGIQDIRKSLTDWKKGPRAGMRSDLRRSDQPVLFVHTPRTGGRSLEKLLGVKRLSHSFPSDRLKERHWLDAFVIVSVRNPVDRFFSGYFGACRAPRSNFFVKHHGWGVKDLNPIEYFELLKKYPQFVTPQTQWTDFPSQIKPRADLVLKLEDVATWEDQIRAAGVNLGDRRLPHVGKSGNRKEYDLNDLGLSRDAFESFCLALESHYASDYDAFGYSPGHWRNGLIGN